MRKLNRVHAALWADNVRDVRHRGSSSSAKVEDLGSRADVNVVNTCGQRKEEGRSFNLKEEKNKQRNHRKISIFSVPPRIAAAIFDRNGFHTRYSIFAPAVPSAFGGPSTCDQKTGNRVSQRPQAVLQHDCG